MSRQVTFEQRVEFGDCDPVGIVWFPNYFRWLDAASRHFFISCGVPPWRTTLAERGIVGTPLVSSNANFSSPVSYDDVLLIETEVREWGKKSFVQHHRVLRLSNSGEAPQLVMQADETRVFAGYQEGRLRAIPIPEDYLALCS
ncbi:MULTISPECIES: acyl-CoA thioesterase [unclassified Acidovorax]|uniref:4-hydroxybenzyl-CoA thioesterase n=2 Tax=Pseudomonadota TaxID=1224 RepID=A0A7M1LE36_9BURK|nr:MULTISPECIES: acyl-CoA thioesterase [unclassified Acidovorax]AAF16410.1 4-hydroxybenzoyl CoA thioesterase [Pseudomonas sp. DJ-12]ATG71401.1 4-hydroxybenzoyl CoA thioesterase [Acidovorax sp.]QOQ86081.1 4-hydroxybenzyl-CoA thioesterase [Comamonas sediminis]